MKVKRKEISIPLKCQWAPPLKLFLLSTFSPKLGGKKLVGHRSKQIPPFSFPLAYSSQPNKRFFLLSLLFIHFSSTFLKPNIILGLTIERIKLKYENVFIDKLLNMRLKVELCKFINKFISCLKVMWAKLYWRFSFILERFN